MSENVEGHDQVPEGDEVRKVQQVDVDALTERLEKLEQSNKRLLDESKSWKAKYQSVKSDVEERENQALKESNDFKGLYEKTLAQVEELKNNYHEVQKASFDTALKYEVAKHGSDAEDTDILLAAVKTKKRDLLGFDKDLKQWKGVDLAIDELRTSNPGLFRRNVPGLENGRPQTNVPKEQTLDDRIADDPMSVFKEVLKDTF